MKRITLVFFAAVLYSFSLQNLVLAAESDVIIKEINGLVQVQKLGESQWSRAEESSTVTSGDKVRSFLESSALLVFPNGGEFRLRENTSLDIKDVSEDAANKLSRRELKLNLGSLHYKVPPKKDKAAEFKIHSSTSIVGITGTEGIITAMGEGKLSENILIEGATYNTDDQGRGGTFQRGGNIYRNNGGAGELFSADVGTESDLRMAIDGEYIDLIAEAVKKFKAKRDEGYQVGKAEALITQAFFYLEKREYALVSQAAEQVNMVLAKARRVTLPDNLDEKIAELLNSLEDKERNGYDVSKPYVLVAKAQSQKQRGEIGNIKQILTQAEKELALIAEGDLPELGQGTFPAYFEHAQKRVLQKGEQGFSTAENRALLREAEMFYEQGEKSRAYLFMSEAEEKLSLALKSVSEAFAAKIADLEEGIKAKKDADYPTRDLELRLEKVKVYIKEENFLKARESVTAIEKGFSVLAKGVSADWQLKIADLKKDVNYRRSIGYSLGEIPGLIGAIESFQAEGDMVNLEIAYDEAIEELAKLKLPDGFKASWENFLKQRDAKSGRGYNLTVVDELSAQAKTAMEMGDIKSARTFLAQAKKALTELIDQEAPKVQVITFKESEDAITVEGYASDNTKVRDVTVNGYAVELSKDGTFSFSTVPNPSLQKLSVLAVDIEGNVSAPIVLTVTTTGKAVDVKASLKDVKLDYTEDSLIASGEFAPGGRVRVADRETVCDGNGRFKMVIKPGRNQAMASIAVSGVITDDTTTEEIILSVEDRWDPRIKITKVSFDNNVLPALNVEPIKYDADKLSVSGQVILTQMANIEGRAFDLGGEIESLMVEGAAVDIRKDGTFNASLTVDRSRTDPIVKLTAIDKAGNIVETEAVLDTTWNWPLLKVNDARTFQRSLGKFSREIFLTREMTDIAIVLENAEGEALVSRRLPVAAVLPPELEIQDVRHEGGKIIISGRTTADGVISDKNRVLFKEDVEVARNIAFTLTADYPPVDREVTLVAVNIEGKLSREVTIIAGPPKDNKAPVLYLSSPQKDKKGMVIKGFVEDDSEIAKLVVHGSAVEISEQGAFTHRVDSVDGLDFIEIAASDIFENETKKIIVINDKEKPQIFVDTWEAKDGRLIISGKAMDNIAVKQVLLNDMPIAVGEEKILSFFYNGALTERSQDAVITAVDLLNNEAKEGPRKITIPKDEAAPKGKAIRMEYGSPVVYASGEVVDPSGIKAVYVNGQEVELFDDGTFSVKVHIDVGLPKIEMETPLYDRGKVVVAGKAGVGDFVPAKITVESEDLSGNRGVLFSREVAPYQTGELEVLIDGKVIDIEENGGFSYEKPIEPGQRTIEIKVQGPFGNSAFANLDMESTKPVLTLNDLEYNTADETVILSGKAEDIGSGILSVSVNGIRTDVMNDGSFTYKTTFSQASLNVIASDYIGNQTALTQEINPPDVWPPVFSLRVSPDPAIIGNPVYVEIAALDSKTRLPEILKSIPVVNANADGNPVTVHVEGDGSNYIATLNTTGLGASLITLQVQGEDVAGNKSAETEGASAFALVAEDTISPSFTIDITPLPVELGMTTTVKVLSSEDLKEVPTLAAILPSGTARNLTLANAGAGLYQASLTIAAEEGIGNLTLQLNGGEDLSGNRHDATEVQLPVVPPVKVAELPLNIKLIDFVAERFILNGQTASEAIVRIEAGRFVQDVVADAQGLFRFERPVSLGELEEMYKAGPNVKVRLKAHNYAGFESRQRIFDISLPPLPESGGANFEIRLSPIPAGQGDVVNISVDPLKTLSTPPKGFIYLPDGRRMLVNLQGRDIFSGQYTIPNDAALGAAMFEVVSNGIRESVPFQIVLSDQWMQRLNKHDFFKVRVSRDPLIVGERAEFFVETTGDLPDPPRLEIRLPDGRMDSIALSGSNRFFQGSYMSAADQVPGRAEIVLNPGLPEEIRRPYGIENKFARGDVMDTFLLVNPNPLIGGKPYDINLSFTQAVTFRPRLILKLQTGRVIEIPLMGATPTSRFTARGTLASDAGSGLAQFVLFDDRGMVVDQFPTQISLPLATTAGTDIFIVPDALNRMGTATVQVNSVASLYGRVEANISFTDGTKRVLALDGTATTRKGSFMVPEYVPLGMVTISVFNEGRLLGTINTRVVERGAVSGPVNIFLDKPHFQPYDFVKLNVDAQWPLDTIPKAELIWEGGTQRITLTGQVPGNRFFGEFMAPKNLIVNGRIEVRNALGTLLGNFPLDHGPEGRGEVIVTPMPPVIGQPLSIKVIAPSVVGSAPKMRLIFDAGNPMELNAYGPIPGNTFTASLAALPYPLRMIEIIHEGVVVESIPVEYLSMSTFDFVVDVLDPMIMACDITDVIVRANSHVPFTPYMSADFNGRIINIPLSKISPTEFLGRMSVPCDGSFSNYNMRIFDPQGKLLWQRNYASDTTTAGLVNLRVMPVDPVSVELFWDMISGVDGYEIRYGETAALGRTVFAGNVSRYVLSNLTTGNLYFFKVAARKGYQDVMVSDTIDVVVGGTTLELMVNYHVTDNDVNLNWAGYPGADMYRIRWGTTPGTYPNMVDIASTYHNLYDLNRGAYYYMKVQALQNGMVVGESRDLLIHIEEFKTTGGEIYFIPEPPMIGQALTIDMRFFQDLPFVPTVIVRLEDRDITLTPTGQFRDYEAYLTAAMFNAPIMVVDVLDPQGRIIASRALGVGTYSGSMIPIEVVPDPPVIASSLQVKVNFPDPVPFAPKLVIEFASGVKLYDATQAAYLRSYEWYVPVADMNSSVLYMKVVNPNNGNLVAERIFSGGQTDGYMDVPLQVMPNPPMIGQPVNMSLTTDVQVSMAPKLRIYFDSGVQEVSMGGSTPGSQFYYDIGSLSSPIQSIDIIDSADMEVKYTWYPLSSEPTFCEIMAPYDPPLIGQTLKVNAQFPSAVSFTPRVRVYLTDGSMKSYTFPQGPGLSMYEIFISGTDITTNVDRIEIWNDTNSLILGERFFSTTEVSVQVLTVSPMPPVVGQSLDIHVEFNMSVGFTPKWRLHTTTGIYEGSFSQASGYRVYDQSIPASYLASPVMKFEITDDWGMFIANGDIFFDVVQDFTCTASFSPDPPAPYTSLAVTANYPADAVPGYVPWVFMEFDSGGEWTQAFSQDAGMQNYSMTIPSASVTGDVWRVGVGQYPGDVIDCGKEFTAGGSVYGTLTIDDPMLAPGDSFTATATFLNPTTFVPRLRIEFGDNTSQTYSFNGSAGSTTYMTSAITINKPVNRIVLEDLNGNVIDDLLFDDSQEFRITSIDAVGSNQIDVGWTYIDWIDEYRLFFRPEDGSYFSSYSPVTGITATNYVLDYTKGIVSNETYFVKVEAWDAGYLMFSSQEESITLTSSSVEYPTGLRAETTGVSGEIKVFWNSVPNVDGYKVYYGTQSRNYNASGSPLIIQDPSATQAVISGLFTNTLYYITVEAYVGTVQSSNPNEVTSYPGTGDGAGLLTSSISGLNVSGNAGASIAQQSVSITNNGTAAVNVKVEATDLIYGANTISHNRYSFSPTSTSIGASGGSQSFSVNLSIPSGTPDGLFAGDIKFYADMNNNSFHDDGEAFVIVNMSLAVLSFDHFRIEADRNSSVMGKPIFVTITAEDSSGNVVRGYDANVTISVSELTHGLIPRSWILSTNGAPGGPSDSIVEMFNGIGNFTVDAQEPETLEIALAGALGSPLSLEFAPNASVSTATGIAIVGPNRVPIGPDGGTLWVAVVDSDGKVVTNYAETIYFQASGSAVVSPSSPYNMAAADGGQFQVTLKDATAETVTFETTAPFTSSQNVEFVGVTQYLVYSGSTAGTAFSTSDSSIKFTLRAADALGNLVRAYNETAVFSVISGDSGNNAYISPGSIVFKDGIVDFTLNNNEFETIEFRVEESADPAVETANIFAEFQASGPPPEIVRVEMDTPWIVHIYFSEDVQSASGGEEANYNVGPGWGSTINKVCWYGDEVTLHLSDIPGTLGGTFNLSVRSVRDSDGLWVGYPSADGTAINYNNISIPNVDYQGSPGAGGDWFEVQVSDSSPQTGDTVRVTIYHKNVCGYLTGDNNVNKNVSVGNVNVIYGGSLGTTGLVSGYPTSVDLSSGKAEFDVTIASCVAAGTTTIGASGSGVDATTIGTINIPAGCN